MVEEFIHAYLEDEITKDIFYEFAFEDLEEDEKLEFYQMTIVNDN